MPETETLDNAEAEDLAQVDSLMSILDAEPQPRGPDGKFTKAPTDAPDSDDTAPAEGPASDEDADTTEPAEAEEDATPAIDPPASWTAEAKERFSKLDRETQGYIVERETERERAINLAKQEASNTAKTIDQEKAQIASERTRYAETLKYIVENGVFMDPVLANGRKTDWAKLAGEDPAAYVQQWAAYQQREAQLMATQQELARVQQASAQELVASASRELATHVPEWTDDAKWKATSAKITDYLTELGVPKERFAGIEARQVLNAAELRVVMDAVKWREFQKAKAAAPAKKVADAPPKAAIAKTTTTVPKANPQKARAEKIARDPSATISEQTDAILSLVQMR